MTRVDKYGQSGHGIVMDADVERGTRSAPQVQIEDRFANLCHSLMLGLCLTFFSKGDLVVQILLYRSC